MLNSKRPGDLPDVEMLNLYGPTEATVEVTYHWCEKGGREKYATDAARAKEKEEKDWQSGTAHGYPIGKSLSDDEVLGEEKDIKMLILLDVEEEAPGGSSETKISLKEAEPGLVGEICIAGTQVARGYLNRDQLNAEKFLNSEEYPHLFAEGAEATKIYRTGDLGR